MNDQDLITLLDKASAFDLYRLSLILGDMIDDPKRIIEAKSKLRLGQAVDFLDGKTHQTSKVTIEQIKQTRVKARDESGRTWNIPLCALNVRDSDSSLAQVKQTGTLSKSDFAEGDRVAFIDKAGTEHTGLIIRLNRKTATIRGRESKWRVGYALLLKVIDVI
jgi:hypothetical protein